MEQLLMVVSFVKPLCLGAFLASFSCHKDTKTQRFHKEYDEEF